jgi:hypothetical protein
MKMCDSRLKIEAQNPAGEKLLASVRSHVAKSYYYIIVKENQAN